MILSLQATNFKSFAEEYNRAEFGGLSLLIGTNASGKSNIRDALRFIHGISRGYTLAEIIGEKYVEGGVLQWKGIRGGVRETVRRNGEPKSTRFTIKVTTRLLAEDGGGFAYYSITVDVGDKNRAPSIVGEYLEVDPNRKRSFEQKGPAASGQFEVYIRRDSARKALGPARLLRDDRPAVTQLPERSDCFEDVKRECRAFLKTISSVRFLDLDPNSLRRPSIPGQTILGDKGENLSSVLQSICTNEGSKAALIEWTRELTPLDVVDLRFPEVSLEGRVQLQIVEAGGREISAESASDGTLRFLAFAAALLGTDPARTYFFEELENGIHPNRAHLLIGLLRTATKSGKIQVIGTTHSPALLSFLDEKTLKEASLVYRTQAGSRVRTLAKIPDLWRVPKESRAGDLHGAGWFEDAVAFLEPEANQ